MTSTRARNAPLRTLALALGTREMGYVILERTDLLYFGVHTFSRSLPAPQLVADGQRFVTKLITAFTPTLLVIEKPSYAYFTRTSLPHNLATKLQQTARQPGLQVAAYTPTTVKKAITSWGTATEREVAHTLIKWYPYLTRYLKIDMRTKERYWENMFDAVAIGLTGYEAAIKHGARPMRQHTDGT